MLHNTYTRWWTNSDLCTGGFCVNNKSEAFRWHLFDLPKLDWDTTEAEFSKNRKLFKPTTDIPLHNNVVNKRHTYSNSKSINKLVLGLPVSPDGQSLHITDTFTRRISWWVFSLFSSAARCCWWYQVNLEPDRPVVSVIISLIKVQ